MAVEKFEVGKYYRWIGPVIKERNHFSEVVWVGSMLKLNDHKYRKCISFHIESFSRVQVSFDGIGNWYYDLKVLQYFEERNEKKYVQVEFEV